MSRSYEPLTVGDLRQIGQLAATDRSSLFQRRPETRALYEKRVFAVALCQGAAIHFLDGKNGIKDLDVWTFYTEDPVRPFPYRRRGVLDFGDAKFGVTPGHDDFIGRRVDSIGRSIRGANPDDPVGSLRAYLQGGATESARCLAKKAVILIEPSHLLGTVVWPVGAQQG